MRKKHKDGKLEKDKTKLLNKIDFCWDLGYVNNKRREQEHEIAEVVSELGNNLIAMERKL